MINEFRGGYFFLSNFYSCKIVYEGLEYQNAEAAFQAQKSLDDENKKRFLSASGVVAKKLGREIELRSDGAKTSKKKTDWARSS